MECTSSRIEFPPSLKETSRLAVAGTAAAMPSSPKKAGFRSSETSKPYSEAGVNKPAQIRFLIFMDLPGLRLLSARTT
ncbi:MAG: hypothetical protein DMG93_12070 [Acidobacteria bacterium]|nr:MAG: hypothetical protein DMG93_12070 [Acidobacteriota bacterium]